MGDAQTGGFPFFSLIEPGRKSQILSDKFHLDLKDAYSPSIVIDALLVARK